MINHQIGKYSVNNLRSPLLLACEVLKATFLCLSMTAVVSQWVRAFTPQADGWMFEPQPRQTLVVKTGSDKSTAKRPAVGCMAMSASKGQHWQPFPGNGDISI